MMQKFVNTILQTESFYRQIIHRKIREHNVDVTLDMLHIMRCLDEKNRINQQELANLTYKDKSSLSYLIKNMEKKGLVKREEAPLDKRSKLVVLTNKGHELYIEIRKIINDVYACMEKNANRDHLELCIEYMDELMVNIRESVQ